MSKNIIILNGDPLYTGKASGLARSFEKGAKEAGHQVTSFYLEGLIFDSYIDEFTDELVNPNRPSSIYDDMAKVYPVFKEADVVVFVSPQYYWNISGQLMNAISRLFSVMNNDPDYDRGTKDFVLLMASLGDDFAAVQSWYGSMLQYLGAKSLGEVFCGNLVADDKIQTKPEAQEAYEIGKAIE